MRERYQMVLLSDKGIALRPQPGNHRKLTPAQRKEAASLLKRTLQSQGIDAPFWSVQALRTLVRERFSVVYATPSSYRAILYEAGFSFHHPEKKYREQNSTEVRNWLVSVKKNFGD